MLIGGGNRPERGRSGHGWPSVGCTEWALGVLVGYWRWAPARLAWRP